MNYYKVGFCAQCQCQIMVKDINGLFTSQKSNYRQIDLTFDDGPRVRVPVCSQCLKSIDYEKVMSALTHDNAQVSKGSTVKNLIKFKKIEKEIENEDGTKEIVEEFVSRGLPISHVEFRIK